MERKLWQQQEDLALTQLVKAIGHTNWTLVSIRLTQKCPGILRTGKQCRERWFNHLNDEISKMPWSQNQEQIIFDLHSIHGNRWKEITSHLKNRYQSPLKHRTENDVKNHFYAELRKGIRRMNKFLGFKKHPSLIRSIRPSVVSAICEEQRKMADLFSSEKSKTGFVDINTLIFRFSKSQPNQEESLAILSDQKIIKNMQRFLDKLVQENAQYIKKKQQKEKEKPKRSSAIDKRENIDYENYGFDISQYLCLDYQPSSPSSVHFKSEGLSIRSSSNQDILSQRMSQEGSVEKMDKL